MGFADWLARLGESPAQARWREAGRRRTAHDAETPQRGCPPCSGGRSPMPIRPETLERESLAALLEHLAGLVRTGDSLEGNLTWELGGGPPDPRDLDPQPEPGPDELLVHGCWRVGNRMGQGGMRFVGRVVPEPPPPRHGWTAHGYACCGEARIGDDRSGGARHRCMGVRGGCGDCIAHAARIHGG